MRQSWEDALLASVSSETAPQVEAVLGATSRDAAWAVFDEWMDRYRETERARPCEGIVRAHEFGGHLRPLFAQYHAQPEDSFLAHCQELFHLRRDWALRNLHHGYCDGHEVHHEPETFLYFQIPLLDLTGDPDVLASVEDVARMTGNWDDDVPDWYDWKTHGFRSTWLGSRDVRASHPDDYQEANHWRMISIALAAHRQGAGNGRYLDLACDYAERWLEHIEHCLSEDRPISMQILPPGGRLQEMGHAGVRKDELPPGVYRVFYRQVAANTAFDVGQGLQDIYRLNGDERCLHAAGAIIDQFRGNRDAATGRWALCCSEDEWLTEWPWDGKQPPLGHGSSILARLVIRQEALAPNPERQQDLVRWAEAVLPGEHPTDAGTSTLLLAAHLLTGDERFLTEGLRRVTAGIAAVFDCDDPYSCCSSVTRPGFGVNLEMPWLVRAGMVEGGTRGSWPLNAPFSVGCSIAPRGGRSM